MVIQIIVFIILLLVTGCARTAELSWTHQKATPVQVEADVADCKRTAMPVEACMQYKGYVQRTRQ